MFFTTLKDSVETNLIIKKTKIKAKDYIEKNINQYANEIIEKWEKNQDIYSIKYFLLISTTTKNITGFLESFKAKVTSEQDENKESSNYKQKMELLNNTLLNVKNHLATYQPRQMSSDEIINFYATYSNAQETNLKYTNELITDSYISSYVEFKKDYMTFEEKFHQYGKKNRSTKTVKTVKLSTESNKENVKEDTNKETKSESSNTSFGVENMFNH